ncbi:MAG TPA: hypothetical protein VGW37_15735 [Terriglobia bacterium]|nr:hypothetical protein [Terriglobia bacterium]
MLTLRKFWLIPPIVLLAVALGAYIMRERLERVVIAYRISQAHIFTPPPGLGESCWRRLWESAHFYWDFSEFPVARNDRLKQFDPVLRPLVREIVRRQSAGEGMQYSMHIYREVRWLLNFTPDTEAIRARMSDLGQSLSEPAEQKLATEQQASDGSWGLGIKAWYLRLYYSVDQIKSCRESPQYPLAFLDRINSPKRLTAQLNSVLLDDLTKTQEFNREQLDETFSALARLLFADQPSGCYAFHPGLGDALRTFVEHWQNPTTGCWGQWIVDPQGRIWKMDDMAMTFHVVSDLHGEVPHLDLIAKRVLQLDTVNFPAGIRFDGHYENHLNWDAVKIFRYAWPALDAATRERARAEISRMLNWCLTESYQPDGSFRVSELDDTLGDAYYYWVCFLQDAGYFHREERFWTDQEFPDAKAIHDRIEARLKSIGLNDSKLKDAFEILQGR